MQQMNTEGITEEQKEKNIKTIYAFMLASPVIYGVMCELISRFVADFAKGPGFAHLPDAQYAILRTGVLLASGIITVLIIMCRLAINLEHAGGISYLLMKDFINSKSDGPAIMTFMVSALAACEAVGVFGLILFLTSGDKAVAYPLVALDFILMLLFMPTKSFKDKLIETRKNSRLPQN